MQYQLTKNQQSLFEEIETSIYNFLICGKPGVGKSVLINALREYGSKFYHLAAPTGLAALNINGRTLHSIFQLPVSGGIIHPTYNKFSINDRVLNHIRFNIKFLIIDEISMVRADMFDYIDRFLREVKGKDLPFGGIQVVAIGDFFQLPPVCIKDDLNQLKDAGYESPFVFDSKVFKGNFQIRELTEVLRQKGDPQFLDVLDEARDGGIMPKSIKLLNERVENSDGLRIALTATNNQALEINTQKLSALPDHIIYEGSKYGEWPTDPCELKLELAVGAQVIVKMNGADRPEGFKGEFNSQVVNGTLAKVTETLPDKVLITKENGEEVWIYRRRWERKVKEKIGDQWEEKVVSSFEQVPLALAWAISIHKSQGQTFEKVHINAGRIFAPGQLYVALSRCKTLAGISLEAPVTARKFWADRNVLRFANEMLELV